jgi:hypothetical protein
MIYLFLFCFYSTVGNSALQNTYPVAQTKAVNDSCSINIKGKITDSSNRPIVSATVLVLKNSIIISGTLADTSGEYRICDLSSDQYVLRFECITYKSIQKNITINNNQAQVINCKLVNDPNVRGCEIAPYKVPLTDKWEPTKTTITDKQIERYPGGH